MDRAECDCYPEDKCAAIRLADLPPQQTATRQEPAYLFLTDLWVSHHFKVTNSLIYYNIGHIQHQQSDIMASNYYTVCSKFK